MEKRSFWVVPAVVLGFAIFTSSCQQTDLNTPTAPAATTTETAAATVSSNAKASSMSQEVISSSAEYMPNFSSTSFNAKTAGLQRVSTKNSVTITLDDPESNNFPKVVTIDFGTTGFVGRRGNVMKGKIIVTVNKSVDGNFSKSYTYDNFYINNNQMKGVKSEAFNGTDTWYYSEKDTIIYADGKTEISNQERTHKMIDYNQTPFIYSDDTYSITGKANGINKEGKAYSIQIDETNPIILYTGYNYFIKGSLSISSEGITIVVDYGDGTKDSLATWTLDGKTTEIDLSK
jgi:hypothetical protein